jgi:hypothetical protein
MRRTRDTARRGAAVVAALTLAAACSACGWRGEPTRAATAAVPIPDHVLVVVFENEDAEDVLGSGKAPYLDSLAERGVSFTDAHGEVHPSQPNYLALFSGSTQGLTDNSCPNSFDAPNLAGQLLAAGRSFVGYAEDLPAVGSKVCHTGDYARKHVHWTNFPALPDSVNQPYSAFPDDLAALPTVAFVIPDMCHDMHDCGIGEGDDWARDNLDGYVDWAQTHNGLLMVTFDEDDGSADNHIPTLIVGPMVEPGASDQRIDHYNMLRTIEDMYGLPALGHAADAEPLTGVWTG